MIGTRTHTVQRSSSFLRHGGRSSCEINGRKRGNGLEVPCRYRFVAKRRLIKLEGLLQNQVTTLQFLCICYARINNHNDSNDFLEEQPAASLNMYCGKSLGVLMLSLEASKQLASSSYKLYILSVVRASLHIAGTFCGK